MDKLKLVEATQMKTGIPDFGPGDTVECACARHRRDKERIQQFSGCGHRSPWRWNERDVHGP